MDIFKDKVILLTGGTGSFGNKFTEVVLKKHNPHAIRIFSRDEKKQSDMAEKFHDERLRFFIGDVRHKERLHRAMHDVDIVVHAAALKQVVSCEYNPIEAVMTNINGTANIIDTAIDNKVDRIISISTDKAVHPVNLYGATKMTAEKLLIQGNSYTGDKPPRFSCVRYGNVIGSRGSVIPLFLKQRETGVLTITDKDMTRFWLSLEQGVNFVIGCLGRMNGGEVFVPKIPSMRIMDLANAVAPDAQKKIVGIRPGEKIHEVLLTEDEARHTREFNDYFMIESEYPFWTEDVKPIALPKGFRYTSDTNTKWITKKAMKKIIDKPNVVAIVQARTGSTRLPNKVMLEVKSIPILGYVVGRLKLCSSLNNIVIATTTKKRDNIIEKYAVENKLSYYRGSEKDVLERYYYAARKYNADVIVRITSDCPLVDPDIVDGIVNSHLMGEFDYTSNVIKRSYPKGLDVEVFDLSTLSKAFTRTSSYNREHVTPYILNNPKNFKLQNITAPKELCRPELRVTLDTEDDFKLIKKILEHFSNLNFKSDEVIEYIDSINK